jgi:hypothetical protein
MPWKIIKNKNRRTYRVENIKTGKIKSYHSTLKNAKKQLRLLNSIYYKIHI